VVRAIVGSVAAALLVSACTSGGGHSNVATSNAPSSTSAQSAAVAASTSTKPARSVSVHVSLKISDGQTVGVGMPYIAFFDKKITDGRAFAQATKVTVNGSPADARWYFEYSDPVSGHVMEAHLRMAKYWPAHASIHVSIAAEGKSGGVVPNQPNAQYTFTNSVTSNFATGDARIAVVYDSTHSITVLDDGKVWGTSPVSLGADHTPTRRGFKVIMEQLPTVCMRDSQGTYHLCGVKYDSRLTYDGEYLHAAPWNCIGPPGCTGRENNIGRADSSNGCTNLLPADAVKLFNFLRVGDVVNYPDADGPRMQLGDGYGDWNVTWPLWVTGGAVPTS
jgi:lipoprotein-anchoring transpeptidase ErfK/SrfK